MAKWIKEHLGFKSSKPPPPAPPKPDYRQCQAGGHHHHHHHCTVPQFPVTPAGQPDILAAYKLQKERDFEDPYTTSSATGSCSPLNSSVVPTAPPAPTAQSPSSPSPTPEVKYVSPKHRLIKVDTGEKGVSSPTSSSSPSNPGQCALKSPPAAASVAPQLDDCKQDKDNDPKHTSRLCQGYLTKKESDGVLSHMTWPPQSPDLNPIEMVSVSWTA
ncbi:unnamed protein product [Ranitomeya imitator]|uniref:Uncharacterized protein n=1 Tax=Ranitomeya imitator TaxID=111125 RepID=A0ABN9LAL4_9NEOB|nr:unnamed protein product [Ranitomeya imitator]